MNNTSHSGMGLFSVLAVVFIVLKLIGIIDWSWFWVLSPLLIAGGLAVLGVIIAVVTAVIAEKA